MTVSSRISLQCVIAIHLVAFFGVVRPAAAQIYLARFNTNGSLDTSFGGGGTVITQTNFGALSPHDVAIGPNGKIVVTSEATEDGKFVVARYTASGTLDTTFGGSGLIETNFTTSPQELSRAVVVGSDNKVLVAGNGVDVSNYDDVVALARYNADGSLDTSYEQDGEVLQDFPGFRGVGLYDVALDASGRSVSAGYVLDVSQAYLYVERRDAAGTSIPPSMGMAAGRLSYHGVVQSVAVAPSGRMILAGWTTAPDNVTDVSVVLQLNAADGSLHSTAKFGIGSAYGVVADSSSRAVVVGDESATGVHRFVTSRVKTDGTLDSTFGSGGRAF